MKQEADNELRGWIGHPPINGLSDEAVTRYAISTNPGYGHQRYWSHLLRTR
jgi:hypothetical protein